MMDKKDLLIAMLEGMERDLKSIDWQDVFIAVACVALVSLGSLGSL
jgi:hypothetical protein